jgi:acyl-CoA thioesterase
MEIRPFHLNGVGVAHGGALFTLADYVFAAASNSHGQIALAINVQISYVKATAQGVLLAEGCETSLGSRIGTYDIRITDEDGDTVALFHGMAYRKKEPLLPDEG